VAGQGSYFSRIVVKSVEIMAAAVATTVSGYLIAHFSGYLTPPVSLPAAVQVAPSTSTLSVSPPTEPAQPALASVPTQPTLPASAEAGQQRPTPAQDVTPPPARSTANAAPAVSPRKRAATDTSAPETKSRDAETVESRVRAALAKVDSTRSAPPAVPPRQANVSPGPPAVVPPPRAANNPPGPVAVAPHAVDPAAVLVTARPADPVTVGAVPRAADPVPPPAQQAPVQSEPLTTVEIKSRPIASVDATPAPQQAPPAEEEEEKGLLSAIKKIPDFLRSDSHPPASEAPRPPMPVGD
jgi:hypothetical protein